MPKTLREQSNVGICIREPGSAEAEAAAAAAAASAQGADGDTALMEIDTVEGADAAYARRVQAKMDAAEHAKQQHGCASCGRRAHLGRRTCPAQGRLVCVSLACRLIRTFALASLPASEVMYF